MRKAILLLLVAAALYSQAKFEFWPGAQYDPAVPTFKEAGYNLVFSSPLQIIGPKGMPRPIVAKSRSTSPPKNG